jgi:asparagine synthase (glutamine-hydrolysing)
MCGIAGFYSPNKKYSKEDLVHMTKSLIHRGPDAEGFFMDDIVGMGHRRLSIIDLSDRANQPMTSANGRFVIAYNGEVYNFSEIGARLQKEKGKSDTIKFKTSSDTEIILEAFSTKGVDFVEELNGMFAIAIYDKVEKSLYLIRDRVGIKPIYYYWDGENFAFASELKALKTLKNNNYRINHQAINSYLHVGYVPSPDSIYHNVKKLNSGCWLKINADGIETRRYWNLKTKLTEQTVTNKQQAMIRMSDLLISSVQYQLKSDVPFGVFLSGGIDSSLISAQAVLLSSVKVNTFSIGFEENSHNESEYAREIAKHLGTDHHEFMVSYDDAMKLIESVVDTYDEPFADSSAIPTMLVSKLARQYVTVALTGEGGDELFLGYGAYNWARRLNNPAVKLFRKPSALLFNNLSSRYQRVAHMLEYRNTTSLPAHIFSQEQYMFTDWEIENLLTGDFTDSLEVPVNDEKLPGLFFPKFHQESATNRKLNSMETQALFDLEYYLQDDLLTKVDRASMKYSLETRVPYLDHRLIEFAVNVSPKLKVKEGIQKYLLKEVLYQYIPKKLFDRPKQGFAIPLNKWLQTGLRYLIDDYLSQEIIEKHNVVKYSEVKNLIDRFFAGSEYLYNRIWLLIVLHMWFEKN